jgi:hypothetical protein
MTSTEAQPFPYDFLPSSEDNIDLREVIRPEKERYVLVFRWKHDQPDISRRKTAIRYGLPISTFLHRYKARQFAADYAASRQRPTPNEEEVPLD